MSKSASVKVMVQTYELISTVGIPGNSYRAMAENQPSSNNIVTLPNEVLLIILGYISPDPFVYMRLSKVSKLFYSVLTSDTAWRYLDPYRWEVDVYIKFTRLMAEKTSSEVQVTRFFWMDSSLRPSCRFVVNAMFRNTPEKSNSHYSALGYYIKTNLFSFVRQWELVERKQAIWCAKKIRDLWGWTPLTCKYNKTLALTAVKMSPTLFLQLDFCLRHDKDIILAALEYAEPEKVSKILKACDKMYLGDSDVMLAAVKKNGTLLELATVDLRSDLVRAAKRRRR